MSDPLKALKEFLPEHDFFIGIDSDGCAFDSMEIKQKECFCPNFIKHFNLQPVSKYARQTWEFVNLYSKSRGINRFKAVLIALDLLRERSKVRERGAKIPRMDGLRRWVEKESKLGNPALEKELKRNPDPDLQLVYRWSLAVNAAIEEMVHNLPPFASLRKNLEKVRPQADLIVVSQTPLEALQREWKDNGIDAYVRLIAGQEMGTKAEHLAMAAGERYAKEKILMIGDAPGDLQAAEKNGILFFPVNPGHEEESWERFFDEAADRFFNGTYAGGYAESLLKEFHACLPERPDWE